MWFSNLMDNLKHAFFISDRYRGVFVPIFLKLAMTIVIGIMIFVAIIVSVITGGSVGINGAEPMEILLGLLTSMGTLLLVAYILYIVLYSLIEVGSINIYKAAIDGRKPTKADFNDAIKIYIGKVISGKLFIHFLILITSPIIILIYILYSLSVGVLTGGWGIVFLGVLVDAYFATWTIIIVNDNLGFISAIAKSFRFAKENFKTMFVLILSSYMIIHYSVSILGLLGVMFVGWFIAGVIRTYFKIGTYITYLRNKDSEYKFEN